MAKIISIYDGFTEAQILSRASATCDLSGNGDGTLSGTNVNTSKVKTVLSASTTGVAALDNYAAVNQWSGFGPYTRSISGGAVVTTNGSQGKLGNFVGYNHSAPTPAVTGRDTLRTFHSGDTTKSITAFVDLGEVPWYAETGARYIVLEIYQSDGTTFVGRATYDLSTRSAQGYLLSYDYDVSSLSADFTLKARVIFTDASYTLLAPMVGESGMWSITMNYLADPTLNVSLSGNSPWTGYTLYLSSTATNLNVATNQVTVYWGVDTGSDGVYDAVTGWFYIEDNAGNWYYYHLGDDTWYTWDFNRETTPPSAAAITTSTGSTWTTLQKTLPFTLDYEQTINVKFGDLPKTLLI